MQPQPIRSEWSIRMADSVMQREPQLAHKWAYEWGVVLEGIAAVWLQTGDPRYLDYIQTNIDAFVDSQGDIKTYHLDDYNIDNIKTGALLFPLLQASGDPRYQRAAGLLRRQLATHPRTSEGGFWHKRIYPHQMWLDGLYMAAPFYAEYGRVFDEPAAFDDVLHQFTLITHHTRDPHTGLLNHGWDESRNMAWANPVTGCSPHFWGRAVGWLGMALVDVLDHWPLAHPGRASLVAMLQDTLAAVAQVQDKASGMWFQVLDQGGREGNYLEASASSMFVYALAKAVRHGYLDDSYLAVAQHGYEGLVERCIEVDQAGRVNLNWICGVAGLGGVPYRDGSYAYYVGERIVTNDHKGVGAFILAAAEMESMPSSQALSRL